MVGSDDDRLQKRETPRPELLLKPPESAGLLPVDDGEVRVRPYRYALHKPVHRPRRTIRGRWHQRSALPVMADHEMDQEVALKRGAPVGRPCQPSPHEPGGQILVSTRPSATRKRRATPPSGAVARRTWREAGRIRAAGPATAGSGASALPMSCSVAARSTTSSKSPGRPIRSATALARLPTA